MTYRTVEEARAAGLEHPGCRHRYSVWIEGISRKPEPQGKPEDYEHRTQQRSLERQVRAWKRREAAGDPKAPAYVKKWQKELRDHVDEHGLKRRYDREKPLVGKVGTARPKPALTPKPVATVNLAEPLPGLAEQVAELKQKLANGNPGSPWGKKYAKDLAALEEIQDAYSSTAKKLSALTNSNSPWAKKYAKDLDDMMSAYLTPKTPVTATVKPPPVPKPAPVTPPKAYVPPAKVAPATSKGEAFWKGKAEPRKPELAAPAKAGRRTLQDLVAWEEWKAAQNQFQIDIKDWRRANGIPDSHLHGFENAVRHSNHEGTVWANENLSVAPEGKEALRTYTTAYSSWNEDLRKHKGVLPKGNEWYQETIDADKGFLPSPVDFVVNRGTTRDEFVFNGVRGGMDPMDLVGTVQESHAYTSTSVGHTSAFGGEVEMRIMVPKDYPVAWVEPFSVYPGERELLLKRGSKFFVHKVTESGGGSSKRWVLEVEVLMDDVDPSILGPADVMPSNIPFE